MSELSDLIFEKIKHALMNDSLILPTLPQVAMKVREVAEDPNVNPEKLASALQFDSALAARVIKIANSPIMLRTTPAKDLPSAISRIGMGFTRDLVAGLAMDQMFHTPHPKIERLLRNIWLASSKVAAMSMVLSKNFKHLQPDQAGLCGLVHNVGALPIVNYIVSNVPDFSDEQEILEIIEKISEKVTNKLLANWDFPEVIIDSVNQIFNFNRAYLTEPDYSDLIIVSKLYLGHSDFEACRNVQHWHDVDSFQRLGLDLEAGKNICLALNDMSNEFAEMESLIITK